MWITGVSYLEILDNSFRIAELFLLAFRSRPLLLELCFKFAQSDIRVDFGCSEFLDIGILPLIGFLSLLEPR